MNSLPRQNSKPNLKRRHNSSSKLGRPLTTRPGGQYVNLLSKSTTIKYMPNKQKIFNNFILDQEKASKSIKKSENNILRKVILQKVQNKNIFEQFLMKNSDKMKLLYWNGAEDIKKMQKIVISIDFIMNQDNFWQQNLKKDEEKYVQSYKTKSNQETVSLLVKNWKFLHKNYYIIWTIRRKNSLKKLQQLVVNHSLPLHAIFYIKKKKNYTVDYSLIIRQILKEKAKKSVCDNQNILPNQTGFKSSLPENQARQELNIFEVIKMNTKDIIQMDSFYGRVPVILNNKSQVYFVRVQNQPPGLQSVLKCLSKYEIQNREQKALRYKPLTARQKPLQIYPLSMVRQHVLEYILNARQKQVEAKAFKNDFEQDFDEQSLKEEDIQLRLNNMKKQIIGHFVQEHGRNYQFQGGASIYNFVGEMFKRNYKTLYQMIVQDIQLSKRRPRQIQKGWNKDEISINLQIKYFQID